MFFVVALSAISEVFASENFSGRASFNDEIVLNAKNDFDLVPAREFTIGSLTGQSLAVSS